MIDPRAVREFLAYRRLAVVGASDKPASMGGAIFRELTKRGFDVSPVNPNATTVAGHTCYPDLASVPGELDGVIVMLPGQYSADIVRACVERGIPRVWLFQGIGGRGAVSDEAIALCRANNISVIEGACPLMFLEPVGVVHRAHRVVRRMKRAVGPEPKQA